MSALKINLNNTSHFSEDINIDWVKYTNDNDNLLIKIKNFNKINSFDKEINFIKSYFYTDRVPYTIIDNRPILDINFNDETITVVKPDTTNYVITDIVEKKLNEDSDVVDYVIVTFNKIHYLTQQNIELYPDEVINFYGDNNELIYTETLSNVAVPIMFTDVVIGDGVDKSQRPVNSGDCINLIETLNVCRDGHEILIKEYAYRSIPEYADIFSLLFYNTNIVDILSKTRHVAFGSSHFFYEDGDELKIKDRDIWWEKYSELNKKPLSTECENIRYIANEPLVKLTLNTLTNYFTIPVNLSQDAFSTNLSSSDVLIDEKINDIMESFVPEVLNMERLKYSPVIRVDDNFEIATALTFNLHFRCRQEITDEERHLNSSFTRGNVYFDSWHIDKDNEQYMWWNIYQDDLMKHLNGNGGDDTKFKASGATFNSEVFTEFYETKGEDSDLLRFLNFNDSDVRYNKKKVSQSFIRLYYYDSTDPYTQKLLSYSTIFLDGPALSGKFIKQMQYITDYINSCINESKNVDLTDYNGVLADAFKENLDSELKWLLEKMNSNKNVAYVSIEEGVRLDSKIVVTNEYDRTKSSEGFNIYLFADDHKRDEENFEKTIYMKVEFNHAGNGTTVPLVMWPKKDGVFCPLTVENFFESLYIPIKIRYILDKYVYYIPSALNKDGNISLILFEPKMDESPDDNTDVVNG
jgi:hypothetical protein